MINKIKKLLTTLGILSLFGLPVLAPVAVYAADNTILPKVQCGADINVDPNASCTPDDSGTTTTVNNIVKLVINIFSLIVGVISVIMIIIGGLKYITSGGESANVTGAKNTILYAVIGLVVVALAQFIVRFVLAKVSTAGTT
ncbi:MAG TPA: pilin [Patescibacteria group bacterium]|nr:pilin [Patescibacteria group bacterium]